MNFHLLPPREQIVQIINRIYQNRMTTLSGGNLSIRDRNGDIWITPAGIDKGKLNAKDIMCVKANGEIDGPHKPSSEFPFHRRIYESRPDLKAIVHAHPPALVSFSIVRKTPDTNIIPQAKRVCGKVGYAKYALPGSEELGKNIADTFEEGFNVVLLENHGIVTGGENLLNAFHRLETLEFCARTIIQAKKLGNISVLSSKDIEEYDSRQNNLPEFELDFHSSIERQVRSDIIDIVHRAYDNFLMISTEGVVSLRLDEDNFLITPTGMGRRIMNIEDVVLIRKGKREKGKYPSRSVLMHKEIYDKNPEINCIITAQSPNVTAYAISEQEFETRTIPESFIVLRSIPKIPFGHQFDDHGSIAKIVDQDIPVVIIKNDCLLATGSNILETFDRLEVAEFSARSSIDATILGNIVPIGNSEVEDLKSEFLT